MFYFQREALHRLTALKQMLMHKFCDESASRDCRLDLDVSAHRRAIENALKAIESGWTTGSKQMAIDALRELSQSIDRGLAKSGVHDREHALIRFICGECITCISGFHAFPRRLADCARREPEL